MPDEPRATSDSALTTPMPVRSPTVPAPAGTQFAAAEPGQMVGEFKLSKKLGQGGMAAVWLAEQTSLHRNVALKLLRADLMADETYVKRFKTEAKAAAGLNHPNIVQVYVVGEDAGQHFIAQEYVQGSTLKAHLTKKGPLDLALALHVMRQVASALQAAGERGIVHRDIKPENIMLTKKGEAKVADFGLAQLTLSTEQLNLTQEGVTMGTPLYMSPEQVHGRKLDGRSDIYSFGVTCYHMLSGRTPFTGESAIAVAVQHLHNDPRPLRETRPDLPQPLCDLVHRMMAKDPEHRYPTAGALLDDVRKLIKAQKESGRIDQVKLAEFGVDETPKTFAGRHPIITLVLLCLLAAGGSAAVGWWQRPKDPRLDQPRPGTSVIKAATPRDQFLNAMLTGGDENQLLAVIEHWDGKPDSELWVARAHEQLALLYLGDKDRWKDAERELDALGSVTGANAEEFQARSRAGQAVLTAYRGNRALAQGMLRDARTRALLEKYRLWPQPEQENSTSAWVRLVQWVLADTMPPPPFAPDGASNPPRDRP